MGARTILPSVNSILWVVISAKYQSHCSLENAVSVRVWVAVGEGHYSMVWYSRQAVYSKVATLLWTYDHVISFLWKFTIGLQVIQNYLDFFFLYPICDKKSLLVSLSSCQVLLTWGIYLWSSWMKLGMWFVSVKWSQATCPFVQFSLQLLLSLTY